MAERDPIEQVLEDLSRLRGRIHTEATRLPAPDPFRWGLLAIDTFFSLAEQDIRSTHAMVKDRMKLGGQ